MTPLHTACASKVKVGEDALAADARVVAVVRDGGVG